MSRFSRVGAVCISGAMGFLAACAAHKAPPPSADIDELGFRDDVRILASDDFEGRRPGTPGGEKTVSFLVDQFKKLGLKPGNGDSYLQQVPLVESLASSEPTLALSGRAGIKLAYAKDMVIWTPRAVAEASLRQSELVFVGYGIVAPEYQWDDYASLDAHGKTVVVLVNDPGYGAKDPQVFRGNLETRYGLWTYKLEEAARHGAAGVLLIHDTGAAGHGWAAIVNRSTGPQLEPATPDDNAGRAAIEGWLSADSAHAVFAAAGLDYGTVTAAAARPGFKAIAMGLKADAEVRATIRRFSSPNVVALLPGASRKNEYVIYTAHWDHLGRQPAALGGAVYSGAVDDAAGVAGLLMLAQSFSRTQPPADRSLMFIAFTAADAGLLGSSYYVANPIYSLRRTVGVLNLDLMHIGGPSRDVMVFGYGNSELEDYLREAALLQGRETHPDPSPEQGLYFGSDQYNFAKSGVPALYFRSGVDDSARGPAWGQAQIYDYMAHRYRQPADKYSADWDLRGTLEDLKLDYDIGNRLARTRRFPRWYPNSEFRGSHRNTEQAAE